jgi:hypothetical protein
MRLANKLLFVTAAMLAAGSAIANDRNVFVGRPVAVVAELTPEERAWFREHWREMPPEQREALRNRLRQEWQSLPPEERQKRREQLLERMRERRDAGTHGPGWRDFDQGYGQGYGTRP